MSDSENSNSDTNDEGEYSEDEVDEEEIFSDTDDFWEESDSDEENKESSSDSDSNTKDSASAHSTGLHPNCSGQCAIVCNLCETSSVTSYCIPCCFKLCSNCVEKHIYSSSKLHKVVAYHERHAATKYPECEEHATKECRFYCLDCDVPFCHACISSGKHTGHKISDDLGKGKREKVKNDLKELKEKIFPLYQTIALDLQGEKAAVEKHYERVDAAVSKYRENWLKKIKAVVENQRSFIKERKSKHMSTLEKQEYSIAKKISKLERRITEMKHLLETSNEYIASEYKSKNSKLSKMPSRKRIPLLKFVPNRIDENDVHRSFGFLTLSAVTQDREGFVVTNPSLHNPEINKTVATGKKGCLSGVECCSNGEIWTTWGKIMKLYNLKGEVVKSVKTKSEKKAGDITTTKKGYLVYSDPDLRTINRMKKKNIKEVIKLHGWTPCSVCSTSLDGLLVAMISSDKKYSKVIRYTDSLKECLTAQFDDKGVPLYSKSSKKYVSENRNLDICVADKGSLAVVVVSQVGRLRFRYTGSPSTLKTSLKPDGIATDSYCQILTADSHNKRIHILDQDGHFLRYIAVDRSDCPLNLCVDSENNLLVAGKKSGKIKIITYT